MSEDEFRKASVNLQQTAFDINHEWWPPLHLWRPKEVVLIDELTPRPLPLHSNFWQYTSTNVLGHDDSPGQRQVSGIPCVTYSQLDIGQQSGGGQGDYALLRLSLSSMRSGSGPPSRPFDVPKQVRLVRVT